MTEASRHGNSRPLTTCSCKAVELAAPARVARGSHWVTATRARFIVLEDRITWGRHTVAFDKVVSARRYETKTLFVITTPVLELELADRAYQFGFNPWSQPFHVLPWDLHPERVRTQWSTFSIAVRVVTLAFALLTLYLLFR